MSRLLNVTEPFFSQTDDTLSRSQGNLRPSAWRKYTFKEGGEVIDRNGVLEV